MSSDDPPRSRPQECAQSGGRGVPAEYVQRAQARREIDWAHGHQAIAKEHLRFCGDEVEARDAHDDGRPASTGTVTDGREPVIPVVHQTVRSVDHQEVQDLEIRFSRLRKQRPEVVSCPHDSERALHATGIAHRDPQRVPIDVP
ncbi:hypothetical protein GCM10008944_30120 [Cytobacillus oceanisediminis]